MVSGTIRASISFERLWINRKNSPPTCRRSRRQINFCTSYWQWRGASNFVLCAKWGQSPRGEIRTRRIHTQWSFYWIVRNSHKSWGLTQRRCLAYRSTIGRVSQALIVCSPRIGSRWHYRTYNTLNKQRQWASDHLQFFHSSWQRSYWRPIVGPLWAFEDSNASSL